MGASGTSRAWIGDSVAMGETASDAARALAAALDAGDFEAARSLLARNCAYAFRGRVIRGSDAICASYEAAHVDALATFDEVGYESGVRAEGADAAVIRYVDVLTKGGVEHRHECEQRIVVDARAESGGTIVRIEHVDLPGEREALDVFLARVGLPTRGAVEG